MKNGLLKVPTSSRVDSKVGFLSLGTNVSLGWSRGWVSKSRYQYSRVEPEIGFSKSRYQYSRVEPEIGFSKTKFNNVSQVEPRF